VDSIQAFDDSNQLRESTQPLAAFYPFASAFRAKITAFPGMGIANEKCTGKEMFMAKMGRILCPTDLSPESDEALRYAIALACAYEAKLMLLYCRQPGVIVEWANS